MRVNFVPRSEMVGQGLKSLFGSREGTITDDFRPLISSQKGLKWCAEQFFSADGMDFLGIDQDLEVQASRNIVNT